MGICSDDSNKYLRDVGYNVVKLPKAGYLPPLSLLGKQNGVVEYIGDIELLIDKPAGPKPPVTLAQTAASINGKASSSMKLSIGVSILNGLIAGLGGGKLGVSSDYTNARAITFEFNNVSWDGVSALQVGNYLRDGDVDGDNPLIAQYVLGNGSLYVVTERLVSSEITTSFEVSKGVKASVDVPVIAQQVGGSVAVEVANARSNAVKFSGPEKLTFGFKCFEIGVKDGVITMFSVKIGSISASLDDEPEGGALLGEGLLEIRS